MTQKELQQVQSPADNPKSYSIDWLYHEAWGQSLLTRFHRKKSWTCLCNNRQLKLWVYCRAKQYRLKVAPLTGSMHQPACHFYALRPDLNQTSQFVEGARREDPETGNIVISGAIPLNTLTGKARNPRSITPEIYRTTKLQYRKMTGLGLLQELWMGAELNTWKPWFAGKRTWKTVVWRIREYAENIIYNKTPLSQRLTFAGNVDHSCSNKQLSYLYCSIIRPLQNDENKRFFILGMISSAEITKYGLLLSFYNSSTKVFVSHDVYQLQQDRYPLAQLAFTDDHCHSISLLIASWKKAKTGKPYLIAHEIVSMPVTEEYIPFDSSYERNVIQALVTKSRLFAKPLKMNTEDTVLPDFVLTDTSPETVLEVFGMNNNAAYTQRKQEKVAYYNHNGIPLWHWTPGEEQMPDFPV